MEITTRGLGRVDVAVLDRATALTLVVDAVAARRPFRVCFANAHTVNTARRRQDFCLALNGGLVLNDGIGVDLASRWLYGASFPENLNGTDFTPAVLARLGAGTRVFLVGAPPGVAARAADAIAQRHPHLEIVGLQHGFFGEAEEAELRRRIIASGAQLVLAAMGHPRQEIWAARNTDALGITVMCVGALLDFYAGTARRAPSWVRRARAEWMYRLMREPRRLAQRYLIGNATFLLDMMGAERRQGVICPGDHAHGGSL